MCGWALTGFGPGSAWGSQSASAQGSAHSSDVQGKRQERSQRAPHPVTPEACKSPSKPRLGCSLHTDSTGSSPLLECRRVCSMSRNRTRLDRLGPGCDQPPHVHPLAPRTLSHVPRLELPSLLSFNDTSSRGRI